MILFKHGLWDSIVRIFKNILAFFGINFSSKKKANEAKLMGAVQKRDFNLTKELIDSGVNINLKYKNGETILMMAVDKKDSVIVQLLLGRESGNGADTEIKDKNGETVLMRSIRNCDVDIVSILLENGANMLAKNKANKNAKDIEEECKSIIITRINRVYKDIFMEIQKYNKRKDNLEVLNDMLDRRKIYEDKINELDKKIKMGGLESDKLADLKSERKTYESIFHVLNNRKELENLISDFKKLEGYENIAEMLDASYLFENIRDKVSDKVFVKPRDFKLFNRLKGKFHIRREKVKGPNKLSKNEIEGENIKKSNEVLFDYDENEDKKMNI